MNFSFRQRIFITYLTLFLVFLALIFPFASRSVKEIVIKAMEERSNDLIEKLREEPDNEALVKRVKEQKSVIFFRMSVITDERKILYDSHIKRLFGADFSQEYVVNHPEVIEALATGKGYSEEYSKLLSQRFVYIAKTFDFHGKNYVLRTAFPHQYVEEMTQDFEIGFLGLASAVLLLFSFMTWFIINHMTSPISQIISSVRSYSPSRKYHFPKVPQSVVTRKDEFGKLGETLNSLSEQIQAQINRITVERNEKEALLESLVEGVVAVESDMTVTYANDTALGLLNVAHQEVIGQSFSSFQQHQCYALLATCQKEGRVLTDTLVLRKRKGKIHLDLVAAPIKGGSGAVLVMEDRTTFYKMVQMRKEFVANASHELKTPITVIQGFAEALHDNPDLPKKTVEEVTHKIVKTSKGMTRIIKDLLTLSDIEHIPEHRLVVCDLADLIERCCLSMSEAFPDAHIELKKESEGDFLVKADPSLMGLALKNLIENGVKYSSRYPEVIVTVKRKSGKVVVTIADQGIGIPEKDLDKVFERFYTVNKIESKKKGGSGLGLSIVETIVSKHFGKITVSSELEKGSLFTMTLPSGRSN